MDLARTIRLAVALVTLGGCGAGHSDSQPDAGPPAPEPGEPILDRESRATHACEVVAEPTEVAGSTLGSAIARVGGETLVARTTFGPVGDDYKYILTVSPATFDPTELADAAFEVTKLDPMGQPVLAALDGGAALAWVEGEQTNRIMLALLDGSGAVARAPAVIGQSDSRVVSLAIAATSSGIHVLWVDSALRVRAFGIDGDPIADAVSVRTAPMTGARIAPASGGRLAVLWSELEDDAGVHLAMIDAAGAIAAEPRRLSGPLSAGTWVDSPSLVAVGDDLLVAWTERFFNEDYQDSHGHSIIRVAHVDEGGEVIGAVERLQAAEDQVTHVDPALALLGDAVVLSWSRGTLVVTCGGCVSDNTRRLVVIDPDELVPLGEVVEMVGASGFSSARMVGADGDLAHLFGLDYHAVSTMALGRAVCAAQ